MSASHVCWPLIGQILSIQTSDWLDTFNTSLSLVGGSIKETYLTCLLQDCGGSKTGPLHAHTTNGNMAYLDHQFNGRFISRRCIRGFEWPPWSPVLNPLDFFCWSYLKSIVGMNIHPWSKVYNPRPRNLDQLIQNIRDQIANLDPYVINRSILDIKARAASCIANNGWHIEHWSPHIMFL